MGVSSLSCCDERSSSPFDEWLPSPLPSSFKLHKILKLLHHFLLATFTCKPPQQSILCPIVPKHYQISWILYDALHHAPNYRARLGISWGILLKWSFLSIVGSCFGNNHPHRNGFLVVRGFGACCWRCLKRH